MNQKELSRPLLFAALLLFAVVLASRLYSAESKPSSGYEYVTIRWAGKENTHVIRPGGQVEFIGMELRKMPRPDRADERSFYMNLAMNGLSKEGYEFAGMTSDDIVMRRPSGH
jgi:hypothetical protein